MLAAPELRVTESVPVTLGLDVGAPPVSPVAPSWTLTWRLVPRVRQTNTTLVVVAPVPCDLFFDDWSQVAVAPGPPPFEGPSELVELCGPAGEAEPTESDEPEEPDDPDGSDEPEELPELVEELESLFGEFPPVDEEQSAPPGLQALPPRVGRPEGFVFLPCPAESDPPGARPPEPTETTTVGVVADVVETVTATVAEAGAPVDVAGAVVVAGRGGAAVGTGEVLAGVVTVSAGVGGAGGAPESTPAFDTVAVPATVAVVETVVVLVAVAVPETDTDTTVPVAAAALLACASASWLAAPASTRTVNTRW